MAERKDVAAPVGPAHGGYDVGNLWTYGRSGVELREGKVGDVGEACVGGVEEIEKDGDGWPLGRTVASRE